MEVQHWSLGDWYVAWTVLFSIVFSVVALYMADNNLRSIATYVSVGVGVAQAVAAFFAAVCWTAAHLAH